jgi:hypothetical protein
MMEFFLDRIYRINRIFGLVGEDRAGACGEQEINHRWTQMHTDKVWEICSSVTDRSFAEVLV